MVSTTATAMSGAALTTTGSHLPVGSTTEQHVNQLAQSTHLELNNLNNDTLSHLYPYSYEHSLHNDTDLLHNISYFDYYHNMTAPKMKLTLPREMTFNSDNLVSIIAYSCMFIIAASGNLTVFITLFRSRGIKSRVNTFIMHLAMADLIVAFVMLPLETAWHITVSWRAGDIACRILMFFRAFGFYLSSFILVTISLDRYYSIVHPLSMHDAHRRAKILLTLAWLLSVVVSIPQSVIFHVEKHPRFPWFEQCVTFHFFPTPTHELAYNLFNLVAVYLLPLVVITTSYVCIMLKISKNARRAREETHTSIQGHTNRSSATRSLLRCSTSARIDKAKIRTLKMTLVIVGAFVICWTPYFFMLALWWFAEESARKIDPKIQRGLFMFAVSNSCVNPILYGMFTMAFRREATKWKDWFKSRLTYIGLFNSSQPSTIEQDNLA